MPCRWVRLVCDILAKFLLSACLLQDTHSQDLVSQDLETVASVRNKAKSRATLDQLLDSLRLLEEEPEPLPCPRTYQKDKYAWIDEVTRPHTCCHPSPGSGTIQAGPEVITGSVVT